MNINEHTNPNKLERYAFLWSEVRLLVASVSLISGGVPVVFKIFRVGFYGLIVSFLNLFYILSGIASVYLLYRWNAGGRKLFGGNDTKDLVTFMIMNVSGINLGLMPILSKNLGMSFVAGQIFFVITGLAYIFSAYHLYTKWKANGEKVF